MRVDISLEELLNPEHNVVDGMNGVVLTRLLEAANKMGLQKQRFKQAVFCQTGEKIYVELEHWK